MRVVGEGEKRHIAFRAGKGVLAEPDLARVKSWGERMGIDIDIGSETMPIPAGRQAVFVASVPPSVTIRRMLAPFPLRVDEKGFVFDGRSYRGPEDAIALTDSSHGDSLIVLANTARAALRMTARRLFREDSRETDYEVVAGDLSKQGRFVAGSRPLTIDRAADRDEISAQEKLLRSFRTEDRSGVRWRFLDSERDAVARWEPVLEKFLAGRRTGPILVRLFPDAVTKARATRSSRPADLIDEREEVIVDLDVSASREPDCVTPALASAAFAAEDRRLFHRPLLLAALGARAAGRWWGRDIAGFAAFARAARVEPTVEQVLKAEEDLSRVIAVGVAASWLEAGARAEGEAAMRRAIIGTKTECARALARWAATAGRKQVVAPPRRPLPAGFLRGISYAMSNSIGGGYASPRSRETLARIAQLSANSISVMPFAFSRDPRRPEIFFVHRSPRGETDEGTVSAVADARSLAMSAMVKPQIWLPNAFVGEVAMEKEEDWRRWFDAYRRFVVHHALVAEAAGATLFCVGTELAGTESRRRDWLETISAVRLATGAPLTYASNWAAGALAVPFWDVLDAIGVDFYDPLSTDPAASDAKLEAGVLRAVAGLGDLARRFRKPVLFAEAGYPPVRGAWIRPHDENAGQSPAPEDAARAVAAVFRGLDHQSWWKGVYWWKAFSDGREPRAGERGFNLLGSLSARTIAEGFARMAAEKGAANP